MAETTTGKLKRLCSGAYQAYTPQAWLQIYYPPFYLVHAASTTLPSSDGECWNKSLASVAIVAAIGSLLFLILWINVKFLLRDVIAAMWRKYYSVSANEKPRSESHWLGEDAMKLHMGSYAIPKELLETDIARGLDPSDVIQRRDVYGLNEINISRSWWYIAWRNCASSVSLPLEITVFLAIIKRDWPNAVLISALLAWKVYDNVSSVLESQHVSRLITGNSGIRTRAIRQGEEVELLSKELVIGDIVRVTKGDIIPADMRLLRINEVIAVDQSAITGITDPVQKYHEDVVYYSTGILKGDAYGVVIQPAFNTFIGRTLSLIGIPVQPRATRSATSLPYCATEYIRVVQSISGLTCITIAMSFGLIWARREQFPISTLVEVALGLVVLHAPTASSTIVHTIRCAGSARLAQAKAVIQGDVSTVEILAGIEIVCSDRTGTLTKNELVHRKPYCINCSPENIILTAALTNPFGKDTDEANYDPIDKVFSAALYEYQQANAKFKNYELLEFHPFDPDTKMVKTLVKDNEGAQWTCVKGAPKAVLELCKDATATSLIVEDRYRDAALEFATLGLRAIAVARKREEAGAKWELLGMVPLIDPPHDGIKATVQRARFLGVDVKMISGDAGVIADHSAKEFGLEGDNVFLAGALREYLAENPRQPEQGVITEALRSRGFYEAFAEDKEAIVRLFQSQKMKIAITGDGITDQKSLSMADCGIAVHGASEAAQATANVVFLAPGLARIVDAVQLSRQTFRQVQGYLVYRTVLVLHLTVILIGSYLLYGSSPTDLRWIMLFLHISDVIGLQLSQDDARTPITTKPVRWSAWKFIRLVLSLAFTLTTGTALTLIVTPGHVPGLRAKGAFLGAMLTDHWQCLIMLTNGRFWKHAWHWKSFKMLLGADIPTRLSHFGWTGESSMNATTAVRIWSIAVITMLACSAICGLLMSDGEVVDVQMQKAEDSDSEEQQEDVDADDVPGSELSSDVDGEFTSQR